MVLNVYGRGVHGVEIGGVYFAEVHYLICAVEIYYWLGVIRCGFVNLRKISFVSIKHFDFQIVQFVIVNFDSSGAKFCKLA